MSTERDTDSTGAMAAAGFGTSGAGKAVEAVFSRPPPAMSATSVSCRTLTRLWVDDQRDAVHSLLEIRADFSNDRHYAFRVARPYSRADLVLALRYMAAYIEHDPVLDGERTES